MHFGFRICCRPPADASHRRLRADHGLLLRIRLDPLPQPPAGSDFGFASHPSGSEPPKHQGRQDRSPGLFNAKAQRRKDAKTTRPPEKPQRHRDTEERQNRRANGTSAGEKTGSDERSRSELTGFSPVTGDLLIACRFAGNQRNHVSCSATASLRLCVSAPLRFFWSSPLVSWCLGGSSFSRSSEKPS